MNKKNAWVFLMFLFSVLLSPAVIRADQSPKHKKTYQEVIQYYQKAFSAFSPSDDSADDEAFNSTLIQYVNDVLTAKDRFSKKDLDRFDIGYAVIPHGFWIDLRYHGANGSCSSSLSIVQKGGKVIVSSGHNTPTPETKERFAWVTTSHRVFKNASVVVPPPTPTPKPVYGSAVAVEPIAVRRHLNE
jgi:hypothetical protein